MKRLSRRAMLMGTLGTAVSLPMLEMSFGTQRAFADAATSHPRFVSFYLPNGIIQERWWPSSGSGRSFELEGCALAPLHDHKQHLTIFRNLRNAAATGGSGNAHMRAIAGFLTGTPIANDRLARHERSFDQALAEHYADVAPTPIPSLQIAGNNKIDPPNSGTSYNNSLKNALSFDRSGNIMATTADLRAVFDSIFAGVDTSASRREALTRRALRRSVLDHVGRERQRTTASAGREDRARLEQYFDSIRELERRLDAFEEQGADCTIEHDSRPKSYSDDEDNHFIGEHARLTANMLALAFQCDITRVATYMSSGEASKTKYPEIDIDMKFHDQISHNKSAFNEEHHAIDTYHSQLLAHFIDAFANTSHGDGTLIDSTCILFGSGLGNGDAHSLGNIGLLLAGRVGNVSPGRYFDDLGDAPHSRVLNTLRDEYGIPQALFDGRPGATMDLS